MLSMEKMMKIVVPVISVATKIRVLMMLMMKQMLM